MNNKHTVKADCGGIVVTLLASQARLAELLKDPTFKLISVNDTGKQYRPGTRRKTKK